MGIGTLGGVIFFWWDLKTPCIKNCDCKSQAKKKDSLQLQFPQFLLLLSYPNNFLVVCICILLFHVIYSPLPTIIFCGDLTSILERDAGPFSSIKPSITYHVNPRKVDCKTICFMCTC